MSSPRAINVSIVEDNTKLRESLAIMIDGGSGFHCVSTHATVDEALRQIPLKKPDVVLMDINLAGKSGVECVQKLKATMPALKVIMHTVYEDEEQLFKSLRAGASGYLLKRTPPAKLLEAIAEVHGGGSPMTSQIARMVVEHFHGVAGASGETNNEGLTARERDILDHLAKGFRNKEIADLLGIGIDTVRAHLRNIYEKLHVSSRTEAVVKYLKK
ncbi:MAG: DNA-binding response regulator [Verrucomicrobiales bacterium]|nr:DNA-binding response regulator [Verrucomicrobiales bacterium]